jgi:hypothetical protein
LDQKFIEDTLGAKNLPAARDFFEMGAHSGSYAVVTLDPPGITAAPPPGTEVVGTGDNGVETRGYLREAYEVGDTVLEIAYHVSDNQDSWVSCRVGALVSIEGAYKDGCEYRHSHTYALWQERTTLTSSVLIISLTQASLKLAI